MRLSWSEQERENKKELSALYEEFGYFYKIYCTKEEQKELLELKRQGKPVPDNLCYDERMDKLYYSAPSGLTDEERHDLNFLRIVKYLKRIQNCFVVIIILLVIGLLT